MQERRRFPRAQVIQFPRCRIVRFRRTYSREAALAIARQMLTLVLELIAIVKGG